MFESPSVFVDIETNGGNGDRGRITEIAVIRVENNTIVDEFTSLVNPGSPIPYWITKLTGITNADLADAPRFEAIADELARIMDGAIFVAHNVRFDYSFVKRQLEASGHSFRPKLFCTVRMSRAMYPEHKGHSLAKIIDRHGIKVTARHRAYDDALAMLTYTQLAIAEKGVDAFLQSAAVQFKTKTLPPNVDVAVFEAIPQTPGIYIFEDKEGTPLYVGKSINLRQRVLSHFANDTKIAKEMKLSQASHNISFVETETEIEALLLESAKVKELQPMYNRMLRRATKQTVLVRSFDDNGYLKIHLESKDLNDTTNLDDIYGVYTTRMKAKERLESLVKTFDLCPKLMGLEKATGACFRYHLGFCKGACAGKEDSETYNRRVEYALQRSKIETWPFDGELAVKISESKALIIDQWIITGYLTVFDETTHDIERLENGFDLDTYKIVRSYIKNNRANVFRLDEFIGPEYS